MKVLKTPTVVPCGSSFVASGLLESADIVGVQSRCRPLHTDLHKIEIDVEVWGMPTSFSSKSIVWEGSFPVVSKQTSATAASFSSFGF